MSCRSGYGKCASARTSALHRYMSDDRRWDFDIDDMIGFCKKILNYTREMDQKKFLDSSVVYDAVIKNIELIGEAASHIPDDIIKNSSDKIP